MRRVECICDYCGKPIVDGKCYRLMSVPVSVDTDEYLDGCEPLESCGEKEFHEECVALVDIMLMGCLEASCEKSVDISKESVVVPKKISHKRNSVDKEKVLALHKEGKSTSEITRELGCCTQTVYNILKKNAVALLETEKVEEC